MPRQTTDEGRNRKNDLFTDDSFKMEGAPKPRNVARKTAPTDSHGPDPDDHFNQIDAVISSNYDDRTKQRLIAEIQDKYRRSQG
jgi:hypothetical protein